jgi:hypothetical protein
MQLIAVACRRVALFMLPLVLIACSPTYNWREVHPPAGAGADFSVLLPAKAAHYSRQVNLRGAQVSMHMTAAQTDGVTFAVATADLGDAAAASMALEAMREALLANIGASTSSQPQLPGKTDGNTRTLDLDAHGRANGRAQRLLVRLLARQHRVYQVMMLGEDKSFTNDNIETFFASFNPS